MSGTRGTGLAANISANLAVGAAALGYGVIVPAVVVRRFGPDAYGSWYLAFQVAAYVVLLDLGSQYLVANEAATRAMEPRASRLTTAAMVLQSILAVAVVAVATGWAALTDQPRLAQLMAILGVAATASLLASTVRAWFGGLRRAHVPAAWLVAARAGSVIGLLAAAAGHWGVVALTVAVAAPQLAVHGGLLAWARRPPSPWATPDREAFGRLLRDTAPLAVWTACGIAISGVDIFVVRAVDPSDVARYAVALPLLAIPTGVITAAMTAWMPRVAHAESVRGAEGGRDLTLLGTTFMAAALAIGALVFIGYADDLVGFLAGAGHWERAATYLRLLYLASCLRFVFLPWAILVVVRGEQRLIVVAPVVEAVVNLAASVVLGLWLGAVGVALGTLAGAAVAMIVYLTAGVRRTSGSGVTPTSLALAAAHAWPLVIGAVVVAVLALMQPGPPWRGVVAVVVAGVDARWLVSRMRNARRPGAWLASSAEP